MKEILKTAGLNKAFGMGENEVVAVRNASFSMVAARSPACQTQNSHSSAAAGSA